MPPCQVLFYPGSELAAAPRRKGRNKRRCVILSQKNAGLLDILRSNKGKELTGMAAINMNKEQLRQAMNGDKPVLVDFWAPGAATAAGLGPPTIRLRRSTAISL